ncbi:MAG: MFS transporter [Bacteroidetes bacterium]|nr:MAG: MFS transporter [Bacteroidota bacterium]
MNAEQKVYPSFQFWRLCFCNILFFASFNMIVPELPAYLRSMGGEKYVGYIIALFTVTAGLSRPFSGKWADHIGRVPVMVIGAAVSALCGLAYAFVSGVFLFLMLRLFHGMSTGFTPTGTSAYTADIVPFNRRGEAMGLISLFGSLGMAVGPAVGSWINFHYGYDAMFYASAISGLLAFWAIAGMKETLPNREKFRLSLFKIRWADVYESRVKKPAFVMLLMVASFGVMITLIPDHCEALGMKNKGTFFSVFTLASIFVRFSAGKVSDRIGRAKVLLISSILLFIAMLFLGLSTNITTLLIGAVLFGFANGINSPTVMAWAIDLGDSERIGRAMGTVYIALEIGIGAGAFFGGGIYAGNPELLPQIFMGAGALSLVAFAYLSREVFWVNR